MVKRYNADLKSRPMSNKLEEMFYEFMKRRIIQAVQLQRGFYEVWVFQ